MIYWMSEDTSRIMNECGIAVYGFDPERDGENAECILELSDDTDVSVCLGDVRGMSNGDIDSLFRQKVCETAKGNDRLEEVAEAIEDGGSILDDSSRIG